MIKVEGKIKGKARPRVYNGHAMTPEDSVNYENWVKLCYQQQAGKYFEGPVRAAITAYYKIPKSYAKKRIKAIREGLEYPQKKPDADNIAKILLDSLNKIAYGDDSQVVELIVKKKFTEEIERVEFEIEEVKEGAL
ncbi:RusA family crossover junction endodeoxyribonuclease [Clostridium sp. HBUAS56017]|uniref:RusA family crossover junction endodeoxyribonuclease n=1 Tax=Clostridium sp. HBUAS56017 TaxID=2571128 RepID=UPI0011783BA0|nr:RusA family crossover junction endodeoxyribonuclease [Clostridium sp. HBUAS56017]